MSVEKLDDRPQAERTEQGPQPHQTAQQPAQQRTGSVREDTTAKIGHGRVVPQLQRQRVVRGDAKVCRLVERSPNAVTMTAAATQSSCSGKDAAGPKNAAMGS